MKKYITIIIAIIASLIMVFNVSNVAFADEIATNKIIISGTGEVNIIPDTAIVNIGIKTINKDIVQAQTENSGKFNTMVATLKKFNVPEKNIKTTNYNITQEYNYTNNNRIFSGYCVNNVIQFKTKELNHLGELVTKLINNNANILNGINYSIEDENQIYLQALEQAVANANLKAKTIIGHTNYVVAEISEQNNHTTYPISHYTLDAYKTGEVATFFSGELKVTANIKVVYTY